LVLEFPPIVQLLEKAERWQGLLDTGTVPNRAALARREATSTNRVTQVLRLLDLPGDLLWVLRTLPPGTPARLVTERLLRRLKGAAAFEGVRQQCVAGSARGQL
jgi:hypothetical protein